MTRKPGRLGRYAAHGLLLIYAAVLGYIILSLVFKFPVSADVFFGLSFALLFFTLGQSFYELGIKKTFVFLVVTGVIGFLAEVLGTSTGFPFGKYYYTDFLGPKVFGVPEVVPLVWFVIAYLSYSIAQNALRPVSSDGGLKSIKSSLLAKLAFLSAFGAVSWDFMVDPMFSSYGYWVWTGQFLPLPKLYGIPVTNFVGWFVLVSLMIFVCLSILNRGSKTFIARRQNTLDSQIGYALLMLDGIVANWSLGNYLVIVIGVVSMTSFLTISIFGRRIGSVELETPKQVVK